MNDAGLLACTLSAWEGDSRRCRWCNTKLTGRQQRWCGDACAKAMIEQHWWSEARKAALKRDDHRCVRCGRVDLDLTLPGEQRGLEVHHRDEFARGRHSASSCCHHVDGLETICKLCHWAEHRENPAPRRPKRRRRHRPVANVTGPSTWDWPVDAAPVLFALYMAGPRSRAREVARLLETSTAGAARRLYSLKLRGAVSRAESVAGPWSLSERGERLLAVFKHERGGR